MQLAWLKISQFAPLAPSGDRCYKCLHPTTAADRCLSLVVTGCDPHFASKQSASCEISLRSFVLNIVLTPIFLRRRATIIKQVSWFMHRTYTALHSKWPNPFCRGTLVPVGLYEIMLDSDNTPFWNLIFLNTLFNANLHRVLELESNLFPVFTFYSFWIPLYVSISEEHLRSVIKIEINFQQQ